TVHRGMVTTGGRAEGLRRSVALAHETPAAERGLVVVGVLARSRRKRDSGPIDRAVRNRLEEVGDAIEAHAPLVVGPEDVPRSCPRIGRREHGVPGTRVV